MRPSWLALLLPTVLPITALRFDARYVDFNLNQNDTASDPLDYWGSWPNHTYHESPKNWRFPFYSLLLDRFVNGDPVNDDANNTVYESDVMSTTMRYGGDILGLVEGLDYIHGMGIRGIYLVGSPFINLPWTADSYSPIDLTLLDPHFGTISDWRYAIDEIHKRGMYVILDNTFNTLGDLLQFSKTPNSTTPFSARELEVNYKSDIRYYDFDLSDKYHDKCPWTLPKFWDDDGFPVPESEVNTAAGCYDSDFDQFGNSDAFDEQVKTYQRQLTKFSSAQDRLREWNPVVLSRILHFSCLTISMLDIDGYRIDKALQVTVEAQAEFSRYIRQCARQLGKDNFIIAGEVVNEVGLSSVYFGRGRQPDMVPPDVTSAMSAATSGSKSNLLRSAEYSALDGAAYHYGVYRAMVIFLGMDGNLQLPSGSREFNWVDMWEEYLKTDDFVNANTGLFDPRHMWGVSNQDVFRWSSVEMGRQKMLLGLFITTFHFPGIPLLSWGDEQAFYAMDSTAENYLFGRQSMASSMAWQLNGCFGQDSESYYRMPLGPARNGCHDDGISLDHRDASHPIRNILKVMNARREQYPALNDGWYLEQLSNQTRQNVLPGSDLLPTEMGLWSTLRGEFAPFQNLSISGENVEPIWLVYHNDPGWVNYTSGCIISPFSPGTRVKNLLSPYDERIVTPLPRELENGGSESAKGCLDWVALLPYEFKAYVPADSWMPPPPVITNFLPGHDARIVSTAAPGLMDSVEIGFSFSEEMDCQRLTESLQFQSGVADDILPHVRANSVECSMNQENEIPNFSSQPVSRFTWKAILDNVFPGVHTITVKNATTSDGQGSTNSNDRFLFRVGAESNPMVFTQQAMYPANFLSRNGDGDALQVHLDAPGADKWRYSLTWGASWSDWKAYSTGEHQIEKQAWTGTENQEWAGEHVMVQYWSQIAGSSATMQYGDVDAEDDEPRLFPHLFAHGDFNQFGHDTGMGSKLEFDGVWKHHFMGEWPDGFSLNVWGMNADGEQDLSFVYGDVNNDSVLDRWIPSMLQKVQIPFDEPPPYPHLAYEFQLERDSHRYQLVPKGNRWYQIITYLLFAILPPVCGLFGLRIYQRFFCRVVLNRTGVIQLTQGAAPGPKPTPRRRILCATIEYNIPDWNIDIRLGGLGTIAMLMGKHLENYDLVWVVPCVTGVEYPLTEAREPMVVCVRGQKIHVQVYYHNVGNVTYVLLDTPVLRKQTKAQPYPVRMDDMDSAIFYSVWNSCIAQAMRRFSVDLYHINDYHGALAPLHLLPKVVPCVLSLHNAEYQGLWPIRTVEEQAEVAAVFDISIETMKKYVQFDTVFNLLHAASSYIRIHQRGVGVVGVSDKYSERCMVRYPVLWGLGRVNGLPNPDPSQLLRGEPSAQQQEDRAELKLKTQRWAGLDENPSAELFVFVGRMSKQKGIDLIADVFPRILEQNKNVQLLCVGPVVDLYGKFTALKLQKIAQQFPGRVYCKPEFTQLPPFIFGGGEFVLIPSRDEPYGLVAAQFGRKGALAVGARVGGLGNVPGWWYTVESTETRHLLGQFKAALDMALLSTREERDEMRAASLQQSFPVAEWKDRLEDLYATAISSHQGTEEPSFYRLSSMQRMEFEGEKRKTLPKRLTALLRGIKDNINPTITEYKSQYMSDDSSDGSVIELSEHGDDLEVGVQADELLQSRAELVVNNSNSGLIRVEPTFTDTNGEFYAQFSDMLDNLTIENSETQLCIQDYLISSERRWFERVRNARLGLTPSENYAPTWLSRWKKGGNYSAVGAESEMDVEKSQDDEMEAYRSEGYAVSKLERSMSTKIFGFPIYTLLLALGQILSINASQITIFMGKTTQTEQQLYSVGTIYAIGSIVWWVLYRRLKTVYVLSLPFVLFGSSYLLLGFILLRKQGQVPSEWSLQLVERLYACGSSSGSIYFVMNFIEEESSPVSSWILRAGYISGLQYGYQAFLWYWSHRIMDSIMSGNKTASNPSTLMGLIAVLVAAMLISTSYILLHGLPRLYDRKPGSIPTFYRSLIRRSVPLHFLASTFVQSFFFSAPVVARSWLFLFSSPNLPDSVTGILVASSIALFLYLTRIFASRSLLQGQWLLPMFSFASSFLIHPRWAQLFWSISRLGMSLPWVYLPWLSYGVVEFRYSPFLSAFLSRSLWLYLGVLDLLVGLGTGMALMQALPRQHVLFVSTLAQVVGAMGMMAARATILSPGSTPAAMVEGLKLLPQIFPDISKEILPGGVFWLVLSVQISVVVGWICLFRSAQLQKP